MSISSTSIKNSTVSSAQTSLLESVGLSASTPGKSKHTAGWHKGALPQGKDIGRSSRLFKIGRGGNLLRIGAGSLLLKDRQRWLPIKDRQTGSSIKDRHY